MRLRLLRRLGIACMLLAAGLPRGFGAEGPWRLGPALDLPEWADLGLEHRLRYESLNWLPRDS